MGERVYSRGSGHGDFGSPKAGAANALRDAHNAASNEFKNYCMIADNKLGFFEGVKQEDGIYLLTEVEINEHVRRRYSRVSSKPRSCVRASGDVSRAGSRGARDAYRISRRAE